MASLYKQSIPPMIKYLENLSGLLYKGAKFADEKSMKHDEMLNFRLAPDMLAIPYQVQSCCNHAKFIRARLGGLEDVYFVDNETTFEQLQDRISATIELLQKVDEHSMDGKEEKPILMETKSMGTYRFETGQQYLSDFALPRFYFHMSTAYCIFRHLGVPIGMLDYLGKNTLVKVEGSSSGN